jgi:hypothetical protein
LSRTLKDRPFWVKLNDKNLPRIACHNHNDAGKPVYRSLPVKDESGNNVMETFTSYGFLGYKGYNLFERRYKFYPTWEEFVASVPDNHIFFEQRFYAQYGDVEKNRVKHESVLIGHKPTECTINDYLPRSDKWYDNDLTNLCYYTLKYYAGHYRYCDHFPNKDERREYHSAARSNEHNAMRKLTKAANAGYDYEDEDLYEDVFMTRKRRHRGWWC